jgi:alanyl-tRNA synthetase
VFIIADGITPGNVDQPYVLRRLIRRAILKGSQLGLKQDFTAQIATVVVQNYSSAYPELLQNKHRIIEELQAEERQFALTLEKGIKEFEKLIARVPEHVAKKSISGKNAFFLYETYGLPLELTAEMAGERGFTVDCAGFNEAFAKHQELSRKGAEQKFKGGLADNSEFTAELHTATHIMHAALRKLLGEHVEQRGSNITAERLRFDFCHPDRVPDEILSEVEKIVNAAIDAGIPVECKEMTVEQAKAEGAIGIFGDRYGEIVKVYTISGVSKEICGGPHATTTAQMGKFKILKEESSSRGIRRIKAVLIKE